METEIKKAVDGFDYKSEVKKIAQQVIQEEVNNVIKSAISSAFWDESFKSQLANLIAATLTKTKINS